MAECLRCHIWCPDDDGTGYRADGVCGGCTAEGWYITSAGELAHEDEDYYWDRMDDDNEGVD